MTSVSITRFNNKNKISSRGYTTWDRNALFKQQLASVLKGLYQRRPSYYNHLLICIRSAVNKNTIFLNSPFSDGLAVEPKDIVELKIDGCSSEFESLNCPKVQMARAAFQENPDCNAFIFIGSNASEPFSLLGMALDPVSRDAALWHGCQANLDAIYHEEGLSGMNFRKLISSHPYMIVRSEGICVCETSLERALVISLAGDNACRLQLATLHAPQLELLSEADIAAINAFEMNDRLVEKKMAALSEH